VDDSEVLLHPKLKTNRLNKTIKQIVIFILVAIIVAKTNSVKVIEKNGVGESAESPYAPSFGFAQDKLFYKG